MRILASRLEKEALGNRNRKSTRFWIFGMLNPRGFLFFCALSPSFSPFCL
jgi:hypothetical protein